jgi:hypothetical protein
VQFVPFSKFKAQGPERLAMEVLAEVSGYTRNLRVDNHPARDLSLQLQTACDL